MSSDTEEKLKQTLLDLDKEATLLLVQQIIDDGNITPQAAVDALASALDRVGRLFQEGEWFLGELVFSGAIAKQAMDLLAPLLEADSASKKLGKVIVGTVAGDMHDLGKSIFVNYARSAGFDVVDLGVDVGASTFADAALEHQPVALGMCCLLTPAASSVNQVIDELESRGLRSKLKIILGGAAMTPLFAEEVGADAYAADAVTGTDIIKDWASRGLG